MSVTSRVTILQNMAAGKGVFMPGMDAATIGTAGAPASGYFTCALGPNTLGTALPTTLVGFPAPTGLSNQMFYTSIDSMPNNGTSVRPAFLAILYKIGTVNLAATGDQWTHDAATFPVTRTIMGAATNPVNLIPLIYVTAACTTTAPIFILKTSGGGTGYVNQLGNNVIGTKSFTMPSVSTAIDSMFALRLEDGDSAIQDISGFDVTTASSSGTATIYGAEIIGLVSQITSGTTPSHHDAIYGGLMMQDGNPAAATAGSATSLFSMISYSGAGWATKPTLLIGALNS